MNQSSGLAARNAGEQFLRQLAKRGVSWFFANSGTDFPSLVEAIARAQSEGFAIPRPLLIPHENVAVGMAYGATLATGMPQAVMVHVNVGTANALCGLINAARENVPMLLAAGRTPWMETGALASRSLNIHWAQEMFDQGAMVREHVKWDYELRSGAQLADLLDRALAISRSEPAGPVYLSLPREVLDQPAPDCAADPLQQPAGPVEPDPRAVERVAAAIARARNPLIITSRCGRNPGAVPLLADCATRWALPVVEYKPRYLSLPASHPMHGGYEVGPWLADADLILVLDCDVPWVPAQVRPSPETRVIQVGHDPLFSRYPMRGFASDETISVGPREFLLALQRALRAIEPDRSLIDARRERVIVANEARRLGLRRHIEAGQKTTPIGMAAVSHALGEALRRHDGPSVVVNEYSLIPAALRMEEPGSFFGPSPVGGLGWGLPAALGIKLARPDALVVAGLGDGCYGFANPVACHHAAAMHGLPVLTVVLDNGGYGAVQRATEAMYPQGEAILAQARSTPMPLVSLEPQPHFDQVIAACGGWGRRVEVHAELPEALAEAIEQVQVHRRQALLHVRCA
jgi:acetolactate synthase-1/2/3 large subunit